MMNIQLLNKIASVGTDKLDRAMYKVGADIDAPDAIMVPVGRDARYGVCRQSAGHCRCGAGVNNIPIDRCSEAGIVVFNTPGANANGVKELTIAALLLASRSIVDGIAWANTLAGTEGVAKAVEAGKSKYAGCELAGKTLGVIGLGAIGGMVANTATHLGMNVIGCDPYLTVEGAWSLSRTIVHANTYEDIFRAADYITLHVPATPQTKNMINAETLAMMKDGTKLINLSRRRSGRCGRGKGCAGERQAELLCHRLPYRSDGKCAGHHHHPASRGIDGRERGQLRGHGGHSAGRLSAERQH